MVRGYLPPEGPQNVHGVPYTWAEGQSAHRVANKVIHGPQAVILTSDEDAWALLERCDLTRVPQDVAEAALDARQSDGEETAAQVIEEWQDDGGEPADPEDDPEDPAPEEQKPGTDGPAIPTNLAEKYQSGEVPYRGEDTITLQHLAQAYGIPANQPAEDLIEELEQVGSEA